MKCLKSTRSSFATAYAKIKLVALWKPWKEISKILSSIIIELLDRLKNPTKLFLLIIWSFWFISKSSTLITLPFQFFFKVSSKNLSLAGIITTPFGFKCLFISHFEKLKGDET